MNNRFVSRRRFTNNDLRCLSCDQTFASATNRKEKPLRICHSSHVSSSYPTASRQKRNAQHTNDTRPRNPFCGTAVPVTWSYVHIRNVYYICGGIASISSSSDMHGTNVGLVRSVVYVKTTAADELSPDRGERAQAQARLDRMFSLPQTTRQLSFTLLHW